VYLECCNEVVFVVDYVGFIEKIIKIFEVVLVGLVWVVGIELNLVW